MCRFDFDLCENETYNKGINEWIAGIVKFLLHVNEQHWMIQSGALLLAAPWIILIYGMEQILSSPLLLQVTEVMSLGVVFCGIIMIPRPPSIKNNRIRFCINHYHQQRKGDPAKDLRSQNFHHCILVSMHVHIGLGCIQGFFLF
jgi:hypothetical protein